jgi:hypothetical protein
MTHAPLPFFKLLFRPRYTPFLLAPQIPRILRSGVYRSGSGGLRRMASESTSTATAARATSPVPAVNGDVVVRAGGKFRFADVSWGVLGIWGLLCLLACLWGFWGGGEAMAFFLLLFIQTKRVPLSLPLYNPLPPMSFFPLRLPLQPPPFPKPPPESSL